MRHGSLFSGIGGFDLAAEWMGWENVFHCEWNEFGQKVLHHYWPNAETFTDITKTDFTKYYGSIDIISGGFPCQPYSSAGKRKGKEDERHLWPEMCRAIREISPSFVVGENVRGLTNWNGGMVFDEVCAELESLGYQVAPVIIPACAVGAPHKRERIWFVAKNTGSNGCLQREFEQKGTEIWQQRDIGAGSSERFYLSEGVTTNTSGSRFKTDDSMRESETKIEPSGSYGENVFTNATGIRFRGNGTGEQSQLETFGTRNGVGEENVANTNGNGLNQRNGNDEIKSSQARINAQRNANTGNVDGDATNTTSTRRGEDNGERKSRFNDQKSSPNDWGNFPTQSPICGGDDGIPTELDGITFSKWRNESIKAYGNAIVPQVALQIFKAIIDTEK